MAFQIEIGVPVPKRAAGRSGSKYPFADMDIGDSFLVPGDIKVGTIRSAVGAYSKGTEAKFAVRATDEGVRVWRIQPEPAPAKKAA